MAVLKLITGVPGSGKTTYIKNNMSENDKHVSRDFVRFSLLKENDKYFDKEDEVFKEWVWLIQKYLNAGFDVWADATHLNKKSRYKTLINLKLSSNDTIEVYNIISDLNTCLERNARREGREFVPEDVIENMYKSYTPATLNEFIRFKKIINVRGV